MKKISKEYIIALLLGTVFIIAAMAPIPYRYAVSPPNQVYNGTEFWSDDYSAYVSYITQGQQGKWLVYDTHTAEPNLPGILIHEEYLLWGKLTGVFGIDPSIAYHLMRFVLGSLLIFLIYKLITLIFSSSSLRLAAFFLALFVGGLPALDPSSHPNFQLGNLQFAISSYIPWLTELDVFYRFVSLPHYLLGNIFFVASLIQFTKLQRVNDIIHHKSSFISLVALGLGMGFTHAVSLVTFYATLGVFLLLKWTIHLLVTPLSSKSLPVLLRQILDDAGFLILYVLLTSSTLFYFKFLLTLSPWSNLSAAWEATSEYFVPLKDLLLAIGPTVFFAPFGFLLLLANKTKLSNSVNQPSSQFDNSIIHNFPVLLLLSWPLSFFLLFYFSHPFLHISQVRFFQSYSFIALAILAAPVIVGVARILSRELKPPLLRLLLLLLLLLLVFAPTYPLFQTSFVGRFTYYSDFNYLIYPPKDWVNGIYWLRDHADHNTVVLGGWQAGHVIPFMAGNYVYYGHMWGTLNLQDKMSLADTLFTGSMTVPSAADFFKTNRISYVFWGYEEKGRGGNPDKYDSLYHLVYVTPAVSIYQVSP